MSHVVLPRERDIASSPRAHRDAWSRSGATCGRHLRVGARHRYGSVTIRPQPFRNGVCVGIIGARSIERWCQAPLRHRYGSLSQGGVTKRHRTRGATPAGCRRCSKKQRAGPGKIAVTLGVRRSDARGNAQTQTTRRGRRCRSGGLYSSGPTRTSILPVFSPRKSPANAAGSCSMPSSTVSRRTIFPPATHGPTSAMKS